MLSPRLRLGGLGASGLLGYGYVALDAPYTSYTLDMLDVGTGTGTGAGKCRKAGRAANGTAAGRRPPESEPEHEPALY